MFENFTNDMNNNTNNNNHIMYDTNPLSKRIRAGSISGRLRAASDLMDCGLIDNYQKGVIKDLIISGDTTLQIILDKYGRGDTKDLEELIKKGSFSRRQSIDILDGLDADFFASLQTNGDVAAVFDDDDVEEGYYTLQQYDEDIINPPNDANNLHNNQTNNIYRPRTSSLDSNFNFKLFDNLPSHSGNFLSDTVDFQLHDLSPRSQNEEPFKLLNFFDHPLPSSSSNSNGIGFGMDTFYSSKSKRRGSGNSEMSLGMLNQNDIESVAMNAYEMVGQTLSQAKKQGGNDRNTTKKTTPGRNSFTLPVGQTNKLINKPKGDLMMNQPIPKIRKQMRIPGQSGNATQDIDMTSQLDDTETSSSNLFSNLPTFGVGSHLITSRKPTFDQKAFVDIKSEKSTPFGRSSTMNNNNNTGSNSMSNGLFQTKNVALMSKMPSTALIGIYSPEQRRMRIEKFIEKRNRRVWTKKVKYDVRKNFADSRLRVKGRFVKKEDEDIMRELLDI